MPEVVAVTKQPLAKPQLVSQTESKAASSMAKTKADLKALTLVEPLE